MAGTTRKTYQLITAALLAAVPAPEQSVPGIGLDDCCGRAERAAWERTCRIMAHALKGDNPHFDEEMLFQALGIGSAASSIPTRALALQLAAPDLLEMLSNTTASLDTALAHYGASMYKNDFEARTALVSRAEKLMAKIR